MNCYVIDNSKTAYFMIIMLKNFIIYCICYAYCFCHVQSLPIEVTCMSATMFMADANKDAENSEPTVSHVHDLFKYNKSPQYTPCTSGRRHLTYI